MSAMFDSHETLLSAIDWKKMGVEEWLIQYGNWVESGTDRGVKGYSSPCGEFLMRNVEQHRRPSKFSACDIEDHEARAVGRLIIDLGGFEARAIILIYELGMSYRDTANYLGTSVRGVERSLDFARGWMRGVMGIKNT